MKLLIFITYISLLLLTSLNAEDKKVDVLLEKVQEAQTKEEKNILISQLKLELAKINKKAREESNAIINAKKKIPSKLFNNIK